MTKPAEKLPPRARPKLPLRDQCNRGHDLNAPKARDSRGGCNVCAQIRKEAKRLGLPPIPMPRIKVCRYGHDLTGPNARASSGRCRVCQTLSDAKRKAEAKRFRELRGIKSTKPHRDMNRVSEVEAEALRTRMLLDWDARIERETLHWVKAELRQQRDREVERFNRTQQRQSQAGDRESA